jgi:MFS family permease
MLGVSQVYPIVKHFAVDRFAATPQQTGFFVSSALIAYVIFAPTWGAVSDKLGKRKPLIVIGFLLSSIFMLSLSFAGSLNQLYILRFLEGTFTIMTLSLLMTKVLDITEKTKYGKGMGIVGAGIMFGNTFGILIGGKLGKIDILYPFYSASVILFFSALVSFFLLYEMQITKSKRFSEVVSLLKEERRLGIPYIYSFLERLGAGVFVSLLPLYLGSMHGLDPAKIGMYLAAFMLTFSIFMYPSGILTDRIGRKIPLIIGGIFYGALIALTGFINILALHILMILVGISAAVLYPPTLALVGDLTKAEKRGFAIGGANLFGSVGFAVGPIFSTTLLSFFDYGKAFFIVGLIIVIVVLIMAQALRAYLT